MTTEDAETPFHEAVTTTPLNPDAEPIVAETAADEERPSIASLLLPPVGSVNPDGWKNPVARTSKRTYVPPQFDPETRAALQAKVAEEERQALEDERRATESAEARASQEAEARAEAQKHAARKLFKKPAVKVPAVLKHRAETPQPAQPAQPAQADEDALPATEGMLVPEEPPADSWTSSSSAIENLHKQFFARPEELRPAPVEDQVLETGPDLQLRIYMREILEPWWTGEIGSTTALKRLAALRDSLTEDPT